jgi:predicted DNA-binding transcriptional regulator AlpA
MKKTVEEVKAVFRANEGSRLQITKKPSPSTVNIDELHHAVAESNQQSNSHVTEGAVASKILRLQSVIGLTGLSRSSIYLQISKGTFPRQVSLGGKGSRMARERSPYLA